MRIARSASQTRRAPWLLGSVDQRFASANPEEIPRLGTSEATPGYRTNALIPRRAGVTRDELGANWFANHMPAVVRGMAPQALAGRPHAHRYTSTLFDVPAQGPAAWLVREYERRMARRRPS